MSTDRSHWMRATASSGLLAAAFSLAFAPAVFAAVPPGPGAGDGPSVSELIVTASRTVSELTVSAKIKCLAPDKLSRLPQRPRVVSSFPARGSVVQPGLLVLRVTFNQAMACDGMLTAAPPLENPCPGAVQEMLLSYDRKTVRTVCQVAANTQYGVWLSQDPVARSFVGLTGLPSEPYRLNFSTSGGPAVRSVCEAMAADQDTASQIRKRRPLDCSSEPASPGG